VDEGQAAQLAKLTTDVAELREGQDELLCMYEELGQRYPKSCLCAAMRDRARAEVLAFDPFAPMANHEDYQPD
jgi:hypothetical protein